MCIYKSMERKDWFISGVWNCLEESSCIVIFEWSDWSNKQLGHCFKRGK